MRSFERKQDFKTPRGEKESLKEENKLLKIANFLHEFSRKASDEEKGIDPLTGAKNRKTFEHELERSLERIRGEISEQRAGGEVLKEVSLIFMDIDYFKNINDTYGHPIGDEVLRKVSALLIDSVRGTDIVARVGGEEFVVLLRGANESDAAREAEKLRAKIEQLTFDAHPDLTVTASFGVISSKISQDAKDLYAGADQALYAAKHAGRNQVSVSGKE